MTKCEGYSDALEERLKMNFDCLINIKIWQLEEVRRGTKLTFLVRAPFFLLGFNTHEWLPTNVE